MVTRGERGGATPRAVSTAPRQDPRRPRFPAGLTALIGLQLPAYNAPPVVGVLLEGAGTAARARGHVCELKPKHRLLRFRSCKLTQPRPLLPHLLSPGSASDWSPNLSSKQKEGSPLALLVGGGHTTLCPVHTNLLVRGGRGLFMIGRSALSLRLPLSWCQSSHYDWSVFASIFLAGRVATGERRGEEVGCAVVRWL